MNLPDLQSIFLQLTTGYRCSSDEALTLWEEIVAHYSHPGRHYHNLSHLSQMLEELNGQQQHVSHWDALLFAVFYHDIIYRSTSDDNEEQSAQIAKQRLTGIGFPHEELERCRQYIIATKSHMASEDPDSNLIVDADLSILGKSWEQYQVYCRAIRMEYSVYPDFLYNPGRKKVLKHFLDMDRIFKTDAFRSRYEEQARNNISCELEALS